MFKKIWYHSRWIRCFRKIDIISKWSQLLTDCVETTKNSVSCLNAFSFPVNGISIAEKKRNINN